MTMLRTTNDLVNVNTLDRLLSFFSMQSNIPRLGDTFYQGDNMPHMIFVDSGIGSNANDGQSPRYPVATLEEAISMVTANRGDIIFLLPGHSETLTADLTISVAGVAIVGLGRGVDRPTFVVGNAVGESVLITGTSVSIENCIFICGTDAQTSIMNVKATDVLIKECEFREVLTSKQPLVCINVGGGGAANTADRCMIVNCYFNCPTAGDGDAAIELGEVMDRVVIAGCMAYGDWDDACIHNPTGKVLTNLLIMDCILTNLLTGQHAIELVSACTGNLVRNMYHTDLTQQTGVDPGSCFSFECYQDDVVDTGAILTPIIT